MKQMAKLQKPHQTRTAHIDGRFSKGQMAVLFTLVLPVLLGVMALGTDFSIIYFNWAMVQKAADAAALAGASQLTGEAGSASSVQPAVVNYVNGYACLNGITDSSNTYPTLCSPGTARAGFADKIVFTNVTDTQVSVGIKRSVPYFFGKMIGLQEASVAAKATAAVNPVGTVTSGLFPVGIQCTSPCSKVNLNPGQTTSFGSKFVGGLAPGNWDWLDLGQGKGASALGAAIQNGASSSFSLGSVIGSSPGNKGHAGPVRKGLAARLASCKATTPGINGTDPCQNGDAIGGTNGIGSTNGVPTDDPCLVTMPAVDFTGCHGANCSMPIEAFAQIYLEQNSTGTDIEGCFVQTLSPKSIGSAGAPNLGVLGQPVLIN
jgi:Flp pilus assembly protein TadG